MPFAKRDLREALKSRVALTERPRIAETPGERTMPGAKLVSITRVHSNPAQPRKQFDAEALEELAASIRERGVMQPLTVRPLDDEGYSIIMGERRYRAAILAGTDEVPVIVRDVSDEQAYLDALMENLQRANLTDEEEAEAYRGLLARGYSIRQIAGKLSIAPSKVSRVTRVYQDPVLAEAVLDGRINRSQAQELLVAPTEEKAQLVQLITSRQRQAAPVSRDELRGAVEQARLGVAQRNTRGRNGAHPSAEVLGSRELDTEADGMGVAQRNTQRSAEPSGPDAVSEGGDVTPAGIPEGPDSVGLERARAHASLLRRDVAERLAGLTGFTRDAFVAADLRAIRAAVKAALAGKGA